MAYPKRDGAQHLGLAGCVIQSRAAAALNRRPPPKDSTIPRHDAEPVALPNVRLGAHNEAEGWNMRPLQLPCSDDITRSRSGRLIATSLFSALFASCGGGGGSSNASNPGPYTVSATVSNLQADTTVVLLNSNGAQSLTVSANGAATFAQKIQSGGYYAVTVKTQPPDENCAVTNGSGTVTGPTNIAVACTGLPATINATVTGMADVPGLSLQDNGGDTLTVSSSGTYSFKAQIPSGAIYSVTVLGQPAGHTCFVQDGSGTVTSSNPNITGGSSNASVNVIVVCPWHVGYAPVSQWVFGYYIDQATGKLTGLAGNPYTAGLNPTAVVVSPGTQFLYVVNAGDGTVSGFLIDPTNGALTPIVGSPFTVGSAPDAIAADVNGQFLYVANSGSNSISAFTINVSTGALTPVAGSPFAVGGSPLFVAVDPTASFVYAYYPVPTGYGGTGGPVYVNSAESDFAIDTTTGALTPVAGSPFLFLNAPACTFSDGNYNDCFTPTAFAIAPSGKFLYMGLTYTCCIPYATGGMFAVESINPGTGAITAGPFGPTGVWPVGSIAIHPSGNFLYAGNPAQNAVYGFSVDASSGLLTAVTSVVEGGVSVNASAQLVSVDPSGRFLYANFTLFTINTTTGAITLVGPAPASPTAFSSIP